jgi:SNF2 family DNA or RNA helicase
MLDVVEEALKANDVSYVRPLSKKTFGFEINRFQTSSSSYALLMNVKQGAEGLNLTEVCVRKNMAVLVGLIN